MSVFGNSHLIWSSPDYIMLRVKEQKHLALFNQAGSYTSSFVLTLERPVEKEERDRSSDLVFKEPTPSSLKITELTFSIRVESEFRFQWVSDIYHCAKAEKQNRFGRCPLSLQCYLQLYSDPKVRHFKLTLFHPNPTDEEAEQLFENEIGKLIIHTCFRGNPFKLPVNVQEGQLVQAESSKMVTIATPNIMGESVICSGELLKLSVFSEFEGFEEESPAAAGYKVYVFKVGERVGAEDIVVHRGTFKMKQFSFEKSSIRIISCREEIFFMSTLMPILKQLKTIFGELESFTVVQHCPTDIQDGHRIVYYSDLSSLAKRIYRCLLYDKVRDRWLIEGMVSYNRTNKHFQDIMKKLIDLMTEGEELVPLINPTFHFDEVWRTKATFFYHILSNFKNMRDYGSSSLASLIVQEARKNKVSSQVLFRRLKNKYGLKNFRTIYQRQFLETTGINRIFYQLIDLKRENKVKIIVRQKALANKTFKLYNISRIKLEQELEVVSALTQKIIKKNKFIDPNAKRKELTGPLAVPKIINCLPFFRGNVAVETDASETAFELELREENIIEEKQNVTSKIRAPVRKAGEAEKTYEGFGWMMIDTAHIFPAVYKNENVLESVILEKVKKKYDSEHEEIKVLNCISSRDHSDNQKICRALLDKVKISPNLKDNSTINVKRKILQIVPVFLSKATDYTLWEDMLSFLKLYEPSCHDFSEEGYYFLLSLVESLADLEYRQQFSYYFEHFHRILLNIVRELNGRGEDREERLKMSIYATLMKWNSRYSLQILEEVMAQLRLCRGQVRANLEILKVIFSSIYPFIERLRLPHNHPLETAVLDLAGQIILADRTYQLWTIQFRHQLQKKEKDLQALAFLKHVFGILQTLSEKNHKQYGLALRTVKEVLNLNKKKWGLEVQLTLTQNQNYFIAQYIWLKLISRQSSNNHYIRLQWIKIYRTFYFYYVPIVTILKLKKNEHTREFPEMTGDRLSDFLGNLRDFFPDIRWLSGYDSRSAKELKAKYELENESRRKKRFEEYKFAENNVITMFVRSHPGRESWDELAREAIRIFISIYEDKEQKSEGKEAERNKQIQQGFRKVEQKLKRGRMPEHYSYLQLKEEIRYLMEEYEEDQVRVADILDMVDRALEDIAQEKARREAQTRDEMRIVISLDSIQEEQEEDNPKATHQEQEQGDDEMIFDYGDYEPLPKKETEREADDDLLIFAND